MPKVDDEALHGYILVFLMCLRSIIWNVFGTKIDHLDPEFFAGWSCLIENIDLYLTAILCKSCCSISLIAFELLNINRKGNTYQWIQ